ncbi:MAG: DUF3307 domain-containing protein [Omnitrophica WOR_2 bacterium]
MFWYLLFAHFLGDYPLQPYWMVRYKTRFSVRLLHVSVHFVIMLALAGGSALLLWPYLLVLAGVHFIIDSSKNMVNVLRPEWVAGPYVIDQAVHFLSVGLVAAWIGRTFTLPSMLISQDLAILAMGYLLATYVWYISERIFANRNPAYLKQVEEQSWSRMLVRAALLTVLIFTWRSLVRPGLAGLNSLGRGPAALALASAIHLPYTSTQERGRAILTDILVSLAMAVLVVWAS